jgi:hypothetical protein
LFQETNTSNHPGAGCADRPPGRKEITKLHYLKNIVWQASAADGVLLLTHCGSGGGDAGVTVQGVGQSAVAMPAQVQQPVASQGRAWPPFPMVPVAPLQQLNSPFRRQCHLAFTHDQSELPDTSLPFQKCLHYFENTALIFFI